MRSGQRSLGTLIYVKPYPAIQLIHTCLRINYTDPLGRERTWESAQRPTRPKNSLVDGVGIVAILEKPSGPELLLQKQFRPPIDQVTIEVPAGLVDEGESAEQCAVRELKEETGYVAQVLGNEFGVSPVMFNGRSRPLANWHLKNLIS